MNYQSLFLTSLLLGVLGCRHHTRGADPPRGAKATRLDVEKQVDSEIPLVPVPESGAVAPDTEKTEKESATVEVLPFLDARCRRLVERAYEEPSGFCELTEFASGASSWTETSPDEVRRLSEEKWGVFACAQVAGEEGHTAVAMVSTSESGDWRDYDEYCFSPQGKLLEYRRQHNSFAGSSCSSSGATMLVSRYAFDSQDRPIAAAVEVRCLETMELLSQEGEQPDAPSIQRIEQLPFAKLLAGKQ